jgi:Tfp pilus assembly protein PilF
MLIGLSGCDVLMSTDARIERAQASMQSGNYRSATSDLKTAIESEPENAQARLLLAQVSLWTGDLNAAEKELDRALAAGADQATVFALRYETFLAGRRFEKIKGLLEQDRITNPARRRVIEAVANSGAAPSAETERSLAEALQGAPEDADALLEMARVVALRGDTQGALAYVDRAAQSERDKTRGLLLRG